GGVATPEQIVAGSKEHFGVPGLKGFSVQAGEGASVADLAIAGEFPHGKLSVSTEAQLRDAARSVGHDLQIVQSPGRGQHHTATVPLPVPQDLADALSKAFTTMKNPHPYKKP